MHVRSHALRIFSSALAFATFAAVVTSSSSAGATSPAARPACGLQAAAPIVDKRTSDPVYIPANATALAFTASTDGGTIDSATLKSTLGATVASARESWPNEIVLRLSESLVLGTSYVVEQQTTCAPNATTPQAQVVKFTAGPASPLPTSMGRFVQTTESSGATAVPASFPVLELEPTEEASAWMALTRFQIRVPGSADPGLTTGYGGLRKIDFTTKVVVGNVWTFCESRPKSVLVTATLAGSGEPYASADVPIDISAFCDEQDRLRDDAARQRAENMDDNMHPSVADGGCSVSTRSPAAPGAGALAFVALALAAAMRRKRTL